jgi:transketolase
MRDAFIRVLLEEAKSNSNIILITGDLGYGVLDEYQSVLPKQFINSGVNEQAMMGMAAGIASTGKRVFVYSIGNFPTLRCLEQIRNDICLMNNPVAIVSVGAGYAYGAQGYTHHALEDIAVMRAMPNLDIVIPADCEETKFITRFLTETKSPSYLRLGKCNEEISNLVKAKIEYGKFHEVLAGDGGTILFVGSVGEIAMKAARLLREKGISVSAASVPFLSDMDIDYLKKAAAKGPIVTIEEHSARGGFGSLLLEYLNSHDILAKVGIIAANQTNLSQIGTQEFLREANGLNVENIVERFISLLEA